MRWDALLLLLAAGCSNTNLKTVDPQGHKLTLHNNRWFWNSGGGEISIKDAQGFTLELKKTDTGPSVDIEAALKALLDALHKAKKE
jgi:hypothetical protein